MTGEKHFIGAWLLSLFLYRELFVHLDEGLSMSENRLSGFPSTLLRLVPKGKESYHIGQTEPLITPQFKHLVNGTLSGIKISVYDKHHKLLLFTYLSHILEVRWKRWITRYVMPKALDTKV